MTRAVRKAINRTLSAALRAEGLPRNGAHWAEGVSMRDTLMHEAGYTPTQACRMAAAHVRMWDAEQRHEQTAAERIFAPTYAPVTQAPSHEDLEEIDAEVEARIARAFA